MPTDPAFQQQETGYSCAPACLRWVLARQGIVKTEAELRQLTDCTFLGTSAISLVNAARQLGFAQTRKYNLSFEELRGEVERQIFPIVYLRLAVIQEHSVVVIAIQKSEVQLYDPARGEITCSLAEFIAEWHLMNCLTILVE